jgi:ribose transport system ATP-binding protein
MADQFVLELRKISKSFPGVMALKEVSLDLRAGEILGLLGENGAGKSTLMKVLSGVYRADSGGIYIEGVEVKLENPKQARQQGIGIIFQEFSLAPYLTVVENIFLGREVMTIGGLLDKRQMFLQSVELLKRLGVRLDLRAVVADLSIADQQFVEIAKAIASDVRILVLDEPTATLTPLEVARLFSLMKELKSQGVGMVFISHHLEELSEIADRVMVLRDGQYVGCHPISECSYESLVRMMVGRDVSHSYPSRNFPVKRDGPPRLNVVRLRRSQSLPEVSFSVRPGEILGIAGLVGAGRSEIVRALIGADPASVREIELDGKGVRIRSPQDALRLGIGLLPEDRKRQGLITSFSVEHNVVLTNIKRVVNKLLMISSRKSSELVTNLVKENKIKTPGISQIVSNLSGGNQQKVVIAKWLATDCRVLIFDEPTRGIDVGAKFEIHSLMRRLTDAGLSVIMISSELPEVVGMSDRVLVIRKDAIVKELEGHEIDPETIIAFASGGRK